MTTDHPEAPVSPSPQEKGGAAISVLDQALWSRFSEDRDLLDFVRVWLALQVRQAEDVAHAVVVLETGPGQGFAPVATWPKEQPPPAELTEAVEMALERETGASVARKALAQPLVVDGELIGAVGVQLAGSDRDAAEELRRLRWGLGWLLAALRRDMMLGAARDRAKMSSVLDLAGAVVDAGGFGPACLAAVNLLARQLGCSQVAVGLVRGRSVRLTAMSDVADFRLSTSATQAIERAMAEAVDQEGSILYPPREGQGFMVALGHADVARTTHAGDLLTVPLFASGKVIGAVHFRAAEGERFADGELMMAEAAAALLGPMLAEKRLNDRSVLQVSRDAARTQLARLLGPRHVGRKLALVGLLAAVAFFAVAEAGYRVTAEAEVQGRIVRSIVAPFDGHVFEEFARAGDVVREGEPLAHLDERDLRIELLRWTTDLGRFQGEYDKALAEGDAPAARIAAANVDQSEAKAELVQRQLARATLAAPFDAIVIEGDLSQSLGAAVRRGEQLFQIAPLESYRVALEVEEENLDEVALGQQGRLVLASLPSEAYRVAVTQITPRLEAAEGRNFAVVEARLLDGGEAIRPGMRGIAKIDVEQRLLIRVWTQPIIDWLRLALWRWTP